ncbi:hypothetical protein [Actinomadura rupiterrae]|uniref:hypothetical protein n=1 Tax=Actinomadura rupiterrae TaxID=559627 RepID=UPI0020A29FF3|nr:hypothetical protein [Actinomadura rupiterrae]MCP2335417.1 hypothetical protein [Actinomadura rupiterrae]
MATRQAGGPGLGQGQRRPGRPRRRRGAADVLTGVGALLALAALLIGVPYALLTLFGSPIPSHVPAMSDLTQRIGPSALLAILVVLVWVAWLQLAACVVVEVYAGVRGVGVPARVPLAGGTQSLVHRLVVAALLLFTATSAIMPAFSGRELSVRPPTTQTEEFHRLPASASAAAPDRSATPAAAPDREVAETLAGHPVEKSATTKIYRVNPPEGRHHESLWEIAEKSLGEGRRYNEIFELNKGHVQPDGSRLHKASLIRPGWILEMPADAKGAQVVPVHQLHDYFRYGHPVPHEQPKPDAPKPPSKTTPTPGQHAPSPGVPQPAPSTPGQPAPGHPAPGHPAPSPSAPAPGQPAPSPSAPAPGQPAPGHPAPSPSAPAPGQPSPGQPSPGQPAPSPSAPAPGQPAPGHPAPSPSAPAPGHTAPAPGHTAPAPGHTAPAPGHTAPAPGHPAPSPSAPAPGHTAPAPGHGAPEGGAGAPGDGSSGRPSAGPGAHAPGQTAPGSAEAPGKLSPSGGTAEGLKKPSSDMGGEAGTSGASVPGPRHDGQARNVSWPQGVAAASLLAAGLLSALGRRRRTQMWHRAFGEMIVRPEGAAAVAEQALRVGADDQGARLLDLGLRMLSRALAAEGRALPTVYAVHLGSESMDLWIAPADPEPPAGWRAFDGGQVWRLRAADVSDEGLADVLAPYPGLVSLGTNETGRILVDLEAAHGLIAIRGDDANRRAALAALALELATNRWSDHMRITLVGFGQELGEGLADVAPDRVRAVPTLSEALPELEARSEEVRQALAASGVDSVLTGRAKGVFGEAWMPHYLIMSDAPTEHEADRLVALARTGTRMAAGYLVPGDVQGATWTWDVDAAGRLHAGVLGFEVDAQLVPEEQYRGVFELFRTASDLRSVPMAEVPADDAAEPPREGRSSVDIRLLGPIEVDAPGPMDDARRDLCTEVLVYLATHPNGVHPTVLGGAVWPRGVSQAVRDACIARVSDWVGRDARGRPNLYHDERGRIRLGSEVRVDWSVFRWLIWRSAAEPASETAYMSYALDLVRGPLLADRPRGRYGWLAAEPLEYEAEARIVDVAHRLTVLRLDAGDIRGALDASRAGLRYAPRDEGLWRDLLRATRAGGDDQAVQSVADELRAYAGYDPLQPETEALLEELLPQWRHVPTR